MSLTYLIHGCFILILILLQTYIQPTTPSPPCLSSSPAIPTLYLDSHDVVGCATVNTLNKIEC